MKELIEIKKHDILVQAVCGRELHARLEIKQDYSNWIKAQIVRARLIENVDFVRFAEKGEANNATLIQYALTIESAKNIGMMCGTEKGFEVRAYFIECEKRLLAQPKLPTTYLEALEALLISEKAKEHALLEVTKLSTLMDQEFGYCSILRAAKYLSVHESTFQWRVLKANSIRLGLPPKKVPSPRYGYQNLYPLRAFNECYPEFDFDDLTPELVDDKEKLVLL